MIDYRRIIKNRELRLKMISWLRLIPDKTYLKLVYRIKTGKKLNLEKPVTFCDKLNWLKINEQHEEYTQLVDKVAVKKYVTERLGSQYVFPLLGVWEHYDDINFDDLPDRFVLKCNHDSGSTKVVLDKSEIDHEALRKFFESRLRINSYVIGREYPYKNVYPRIFAEQYMTPKDANEIEDYKFLCFNGVVELLYVATDRGNDVRFDFFDLKWNHLNITENHPQSDVDIPRPERFEEMIKIAEKLSTGMKFARIDLYEIEGKVYFGEYTFFHCGGFWPLEPVEWEMRLGKLINLK